MDGSMPPGDCTVSPSQGRAADGLVPEATALALRCPHCRDTVPLTGATSGAVTCPSCRGSFRVGDARLDGAAVGSEGRFRLLERVGQGAFGAVWKAHDAKLDRVVALKVPHPALLASAEAAERFGREARAAAQLRHPGVVTVHEVTDLDGQPVIVSDFIAGRTLREFLNTRGLSFREAAGLVLRLAEALEYAHTMGVVHRDVKPANVMLDRPPADGAGDVGAPMLMDFGLALRDEAEATMTLDGQVVGTPLYMPPEQAAGRSHLVDRRGDVYSLGVVLYELLTGAPPFRGTKTAILHQVIHVEPTPPRRLNDRIPLDLETICLKAMAKEPRRRYATARELADDLRRFLGGQPILARPVGRGERLLLWVRRRPVEAALIGVSVLAALALVVVGVGWAYSQQLEEEKTKAQDSRDEANRQAETAAFYRYLNGIGLAHGEFRDNHVARVEQLLDECPERFRRWEWGYLKRLCHADAFTCPRPTAALAFSADGSRLFTVGFDQSVTEWNAVTGQELRTLREGGPFTTRLALGPGGGRLARITLPGVPCPCEIFIGDVAAGPDVVLYKGAMGPVGVLAFSPDGGRLAAGVDSSSSLLKVWDVTSGKELLSREPGVGTIRGLAFSPDGKRLAAHGKLLDAATGDLALSLDGMTNNCSCVAFSPDGKLIALGAEEALAEDKPQVVRVWDAQTGRLKFTLPGHAGAVRAVAFSPDGKVLASAGNDQSIRLWDMATGGEAGTIRGHTGVVTALAFARDGRLASASADRTVKVWETRTAVGAVAFSGGSDDCRLGFTADGASLVLAEPQALTIRDVRTGREEASFKANDGSLMWLTLHPDGRSVAGLAGDRLRSWDVKTRREILTYEAAPGGRRVVRTLFSPDGSRLAAVCADGSLCLWDNQTGKLVRAWDEGDGFKAEDSSGNRIAFSPDGKLLAVGASCDETTLEFDRPGEIRVRDVATGERVRTLKGQPEIVAALAFSPDGRRLASAGFDGTAMVWDAATGKEQFTLRGHAGPVTGVAFSPDGERLATCSYDLTTKVWEAKEGREVLSLKGHTSRVVAVAFSPDGARLASAGQFGPVLVWDALPPAVTAR